MLQLLYPTEKSPGTYYIKGWIYPKAKVDALDQEKIPCPC